MADCRASLNHDLTEFKYVVDCLPFMYVLQKGWIMKGDPAPETASSLPPPPKSSKTGLSSTPGAPTTYVLHLWTLETSSHASQIQWTPDLVHKILQSSYVTQWCATTLYCLWVLCKYDLAAAFCLCCHDSACSPV